ncbi:uncharacterized protein LOC122387796 [Amphibalanus amphitrite]|uniref:uncharacterized protein LOC122387796 n=1 Tax=Amphibalanus amphitrite TaxID=1232801 RepID=UPI001C8FC224|nr:uncharacterized protein LOC122387796 [Amphibalanus amphitrite]XP_043234198.1 uncharacterized protein LOC122387796 [Amphibalanus amphitrite]XP_043234200.1 uncharacterized protein LOC122387796 [Amphibalanus amphitrite]
MHAGAPSSIDIGVSPHTETPPLGDSDAGAGPHNDTQSRRYSDIDPQTNTPPDPNAGPYTDTPSLEDSTTTSHTGIPPCKDCNNNASSHTQTSSPGSEVTQSEDLQHPPVRTTIDHLDNDMLNVLLSYLECRQLFLARRVCKRWRAAVDCIVDHYRRVYRDCLGIDSAPTTDLHLTLLVEKHPDMTRLRAPTPHSGTDLRIPVGRCCQLVSADLRGFRHTRSSLLQLLVSNCNTLEALILPAGLDGTELAALLKPLCSLRQLSVVVNERDEGRWMAALPQSLQHLNVRGPEVTEPRWPPDWSLPRLMVTVQRPAEDIVGHLADLGREVHVLQLYCGPDTSVGVDSLCRLDGLQYLSLSDCFGILPLGLRCLSRLPNLVHLILFGGVTDAFLHSLRGCCRLQGLRLGDRTRPAETAFTAATVSRVVVSCRQLCVMSLHSTIDTGREVVTTLKEADLGQYSDVNMPRTIRICFPEDILSQLRGYSTRRVKVDDWPEWWQ